MAFCCSLCPKHNWRSFVCPGRVSSSIKWSKSSSDAEVAAGFFLFVGQWSIPFSSFSPGLIWFWSQLGPGLVWAGLGLTQVWSWSDLELVSSDGPLTIPDLKIHLDSGLDPTRELCSSWEGGSVWFWCGSLQCGSQTKEKKRTKWEKSLFGFGGSD